MKPRLVTAAATVVGPEEANDVAEALPIDGSLKGRLTGAGRGKAHREAPLSPGGEPDDRPV